MSDYKRFLNILEAIEEGTSNGDGSVVFYWTDLETEFPIKDTELWLIAEQYRAVEKERDDLLESLQALKQRIEDTLEDF